MVFVRNKKIEFRDYCSSEQKRDIDMYFLRFIKYVINMDVSSTRMCLDISLFMERRE
jgi:hypothetical protein